MVDEFGDVVLHEEVEVGVLRGVASEKVEEVPLGHEGDKFGGVGSWLQSAIRKVSVPMVRPICGSSWWGMERKSSRMPSS